MEGRHRKDEEVGRKEGEMNKGDSHELRKVRGMAGFDGRVVCVPLCQSECSCCVVYRVLSNSAYVM